MSITPSQLLDTVAKFLAQTSSELPDADKEAIYRIVISRSYYAAFWAARDYLREKDGIVSDNNAHHVVRVAFRSRKPPESTVYDRLRVMVEERVRCDYKPEEEVTSIQAGLALFRGREVLNFLTQMTHWLRERNPLP